MGVLCLILFILGKVCHHVHVETPVQDYPSVSVADLTVSPLVTLVTLFTTLLIFLSVTYTIFLKEIPVEKFEYKNVTVCTLA